MVTNKAKKLLQSFECTKCGGTTAKNKKITAPGTGITRIIGLEANDFLVIYCAACGHADFYVIAPFTG